MKNKDRRKRMKNKKSDVYAKQIDGKCELIGAIEDKVSKGDILIDLKTRTRYKVSTHVCGVVIVKDMQN